MTKTSKVALVTGGSRGIGAAVAKRLAADGFLLVVNYAGRADAAATVVSEIEAAGGQAIPFQADVSDAQQVRAMFDAVESKHGNPQVLVNSAGVMDLAPLVQITEDVFDRMIAINLKGSFHTMQEAARRMASGGRIINISSSLVGTRLPTYSIYTATKAAVEAMGATLAKELRGRKITVNAVAPGPTATELFFTGKSDAQIESLKQACPLERLGQPEDIANVVSFLAGPESEWVNGQTVRANGGLV